MSDEPMDTDIVISLVTVIDYLFPTLEVEGTGPSGGYAVLVGRETTNGLVLARLTDARQVKNWLRQELART